MISKAADVQTHVSQATPDRQEAMERLRKLCRQKLRGFEECIEYGMPAYKRNGKVEVAFASQKQYIALYILNKDVLDEFRSALSASSIGKGCIRFKKPEQIDFKAIERLLQSVAQSMHAPC